MKEVPPPPIIITPQMRRAMKEEERRREKMEQEEKVKAIKKDVMRSLGMFLLVRDCFNYNLSVSDWKLGYW